MKSTHLLSNVLLTCVRKEALPSTSQLVAVGCVHICFFVVSSPTFFRVCFGVGTNALVYKFIFFFFFCFFSPPCFTILVFSSFHVLSLIDILYRFFISIHIWSLSIVKYSLSLSVFFHFWIPHVCLSMAV